MRAGLRAAPFGGRAPRRGSLLFTTCVTLCGLKDSQPSTLREILESVRRADRPCPFVFILRGAARAVYRPTMTTEATTSSGWGWAWSWGSEDKEQAMEPSLTKESPRSDSSSPQPHVLHTDFPAATTPAASSSRPAAVPTPPDSSNPASTGPKQQAKQQGTSVHSKGKPSGKGKPSRTDRRQSPARSQARIDQVVRALAHMMPSFASLPRTIAALCCVRMRL